MNELDTKIEEALKVVGELERMLSKASRVKNKEGIPLVNKFDKMGIWKFKHSLKQMLCPCEDYPTWSIGETLEHYKQKEPEFTQVERDTMALRRIERQRA